jgi:hypothetical protein
MAQIEIQETITFRWWDNEAEEIPIEHRNQLENSAKEQIAEMKGNGYTSGQLNDLIDSVDYVGWWEMTTKVL